MNACGIITLASIYWKKGMQKTLYAHASLSRNKKLDLQLLMCMLMIYTMLGLLKGLEEQHNILKNNLR